MTTKLNLTNLFLKREKVVAKGSEINTQRSKRLRQAAVEVAHTIEEHVPYFLTGGPIPVDEDHTPFTVG